jgi:hypothetical protein
LVEAGPIWQDVSPNFSSLGNIVPISLDHLHLLVISFAGLPLQSKDIAVFLSKLDCNKDSIAGDKYEEDSPVSSGKHISPHAHYS